MNRLVVGLAAFAFLAYGASGSPAERIVGGSAARLGQVPSIVALLRHVPNTAIYQYRCAGTLIYPHIVISAAQCFDDMYLNPMSWRVRAGSINHASGGVLVNAAAIRRHDDHEENDIALVNLGGPITNVNAAPALLPPPDELPNTGVYAEIAGWGATSPTASATTISPILHIANVVVSDRESCVENLKQLNFDVSAEQICAIRPGVGICHNDIGSPLLLPNGQLLGIASHHVGCGFELYPAVYTAIGPYVDWIQEQVLGA